MSTATVRRIHKILTGAVSAETAHVQPDYPYGRSLRCQRRNWLEWKSGKGFRYVTQTNDPKRAALTWNKPHASTYTDFALLCLTDEHVDEHGAPAHVSWFGQSVNGNADQIEALMAAYWSEMDERQQQRAQVILQATHAYGTKPTGKLYAVTDLATGERLHPEPVSGAHADFAAAYPSDASGTYALGSRLHDLGERTPSGLFGLPRLGKLARVEWVVGSGMQQAA